MSIMKLVAASVLALGLMATEPAVRTTAGSSASHGVEHPTGGQSFPTLRGRVLLAPDVKASDVSLALVPPDWARPFRPQDVTSPRGNGEFELSVSGYGRYTLHVWVADEGQSPAVTIEDIDLSTPSARSDPRLNPLDLRDKVHVLYITAKDPSGDVIRRGNVKLHPIIRGRVEPAPFTGFIFGKRRRLVVSEMPFDVYVGSRGLRTKLVESVKEDVAVQLADGIPVRLAVRGLPSSLPDGKDVLLSLNTGGPPAQVQLILDEAVGEVEFRAPQPGRYGLTFQPVNHRDLWLFSVQWLPGEPVWIPDQAIVVGDREEEQRIEWTMPDEAVEELVRYCQ